MIFDYWGKNWGKVWGTKDMCGVMAQLLFTPCPVTRYAMHRIYANRINSRGMSRVFCDLRSQKTPRGILPVNSNMAYTVARIAINTV